MDAISFEAGWQGYALTGRPDLLNYLRRGDVTWSQLWDFYRAHPADPGAVVRLMGLFHAFLSVQYDAEGAVLDYEQGVYPQLREWAQLAVECADWIPEEKIRDSLAGLLEQDLISPLYYEAVFNVYLEASVERSAAIWSEQPEARASLGGLEVPAVTFRRISIQLPERVLSDSLQNDPQWAAARSRIVSCRHADWDRAYAVALGEEEGDWRDEGGSG